MSEDTKKQQSSSFDQFKLVQQCARCNTDGSGSDIQMLGSVEDGAMVHITCQHCSHKILALMGLTHMGIGLVGIVTDLTYEDAKRMQLGQRFTDDDLLECYELIHDARNSFSQIFKQ